MPTVTYLYQPNDIVYAVQSGSVKRGTVTKVDIVHTLTQPATITYQVRFDGSASTISLGESVLYPNCKATQGYQEVIFTSKIAPAGIAFNVAPNDGGSPALGPTVTILIDGVTYVVNSSLGINATFQDVLNELNTVIGPAGANVGLATINTGKIRITSNTKGELSIVELQDVGTGSPVLSYGYFSQMYRFSGIAAAVDGLAEGALEALGNSVC